MKEISKRKLCSKKRKKGANQTKNRIEVMEARSKAKQDLVVQVTQAVVYQYKAQCVKSSDAERERERKSA